MAIGLGFAASSPYPTDKWEPSPLEKEGINPALFKELENWAFAEGGHRTDALLLIANGRLAFERYGTGFSPDQPHRIWSCSKSFVSTLFGIAFKKKLLSPDDKVIDFYPQIVKGSGKNMTLRHLLQMSSGLDWNEGYESSPFKSDVIKMLYTTAFNDMATFAAKKDQIAAPGERFNYSSGETNLLMGILRMRLGNEYNKRFAWEELFDKIGITTATWEHDQAGTFVGSSYLYMSARDFARLGYLWMRGGKWGDEILLDPDYINEALTPAPAFAKTTLNGFENRENHGMHWWLNRENPEKNLPRPFPEAPEDTFLAEGHHGQTLIVIPSENIILVRLASDKNGQLPRPELITRLMKAIRHGNSL
jgi:CubicO group peptidase (beta-lactamase class C family)